MTDNVEAGLEVVRRWAETATAAGHQVPEASRLVAIVRGGGVRELAEDPVEQAWRPTLEHLLTQVRLGVIPAVAVGQLPTSLREPLGSPASVAEGPDAGAGGAETGETRSAPSQTITDPVEQIATPVEEVQDVPTDTGPRHSAEELRGLFFEALISWRARQIADNVAGVDAIKDITLRNLVKYQNFTEDQLRVKLPGSAKALAPSLAAEFARLHEQYGTPEGQAAPRSAAATSAAVAGGAMPPPSETSPAETPVVPAASAQPEPAVPAGMLDLVHRDFADYDYPETDVAPGRITLDPSGDSWVLNWAQWDATTDPTVIYRVVSSDDLNAPHKPEAGEIVGVTVNTSITDGRLPNAAVRIYQVWVHSGPDEATARRRQPILWATGEEVSPVDDMELTEDEGRVVGRWSVFPGTRTVHVYRIPLDGGGPISADPRNQICAGQANLTGFVDADPPRGRRFVYRAQAEVVVGGTVRLSRHSSKDLLVSVQLSPIEDLVVEMSGDAEEQGHSSTFDLSWTAPDHTQQVRIYRHETPPPAGLGDVDRDESTIIVEGFTEASLIRDPIVAGPDGRSQIRGVTWPQDWERAYLTPVTAFNGRVRIGTTVVKTRPLPPVVAPRLTERFDTEMVTFGWPAGAATVAAYVGRDSIAPEQICESGPAFAEVTKEQHRRDGGIAFPRPLPPNGCLVCLVPVAYSQAEQVRGEIAVLSYPGIHRVNYWFNLLPNQPPGRLLVELMLDAETEVIDAPALVVTHNDSRLPLEANDGRHLNLHSGGFDRPHVVLDRIPRGTSATGWVTDLTDLPGFIRLFVVPGTDRGRQVALRDPSIAQLSPGASAPPPPPPTAPQGMWG